MADSQYKLRLWSNKTCSIKLCFLNTLKTLCMATSLSVSVSSSRQMVLVEEDGEISSSDKS